MKLLLYYTVKIIVRVGLFFYAQKIKISGCENIPKKGAVLFTANHPNGLIDPLIIASNTHRKTHFLVRGDVFKKSSFAKFFDWMGMMPVYRIRDGVHQLSKNNAIFEKCEQLFTQQKALLIFPEGSHERIRSVRPLSKGFTRILFGTLNNNPDLEIHIVPVGITYQNASMYPSKVALNFGKPILANEFYNADELRTSTETLKKMVTEQLEKLTVHIPNDEEYATKVTKLNKAQVDFTEVKTVNNIISLDEYPKEKKAQTNYLLPIKWLIILNSLMPYLLWKKASQKISEIEFVDTFRFGLNVVTFGVSYLLQSYLVSYFFGWKTGTLYLFVSLFLVGLYSKFSPTNTEN